MKGEWCYWMGAFSTQECNEIVEMCKRLPSHSANIGVDSSFANTFFRRSVVRWVDHISNPEFTWVYDKIWKYMIVMNKDWFNFNVTELPPMQFTEYDESYIGEYQSHQDVFWLNGKPTHRKVSLVLQLTDSSNYEGGQLSFQNLTTDPSKEDYDCMKQIGTIIAFPSFIYHRLEPVTKGKRYSLVAWFEGPKFQ